MNFYRKFISKLEFLWESLNSVSEKKNRDNLLLMIFY